MSDPEVVKLSKLISYVLRHGAVKEKLAIRSDGYVAVEDLLARPKFKNVTLEQIKHVVETNDKQRFKLMQENGAWWIRANQGHTLKVKDIELKRLTEPLPLVIHGTNFASWKIIAKEGLSRMQRNHIHFATGLPNDDSVVSGMRKSSQVFIYVDMEKALQDGIAFFQSSNQVVLTEGINGILSPKYFSRVVDKDGNDLLVLSASEQENHAKA